MVHLLVYISQIQPIGPSSNGRYNTGPTQAGSAPFLAQTNAAPAGKHSYVPNTPVVTDVPILGKGDGAELFEHMGNLS
ncbi:hypothetical protein PENSUB_9077 [Penicillium subrubescens]|jgi:hypothetical protein|uniref:Uncharacterized protein n=1 Tax=Penicillium subrubescens TaxID=1316194 RepID=A0A1Q5TEI9_9EURO|nr:hypothetical protein PENSUB_9077 [Penicillium subrubescens]